MSSLTDQLDRTRQGFQEDPASARIAPKVSATVASGRARLSAGPFDWETDLPPAVGGGNAAPSPTAYLLGALAGCGAVFLQDTLAPEFGVDVEELTVTASCSADLGGLLGMDGHDPALSGVRLEFDLRSGSDPDRVAAMHQAWLQRCPVYLALTRPTPVEVATGPAAG